MEVLLLDRGCCHNCVKLIAKDGQDMDLIGLDNAHAFGSAESKKQKTSVCFTCLGLLSFSDVDIAKICESLKAESFDSLTFGISLCLPLSISLRWAYVLAMLSSAASVTNLQSHSQYVNHLKKNWKDVVGPLIEKEVKKSYVSGCNAGFYVNIMMHHDEKEDGILCKYSEYLSTKGKGKRNRKKQSCNEISRMSIENGLKQLESIDISKLLGNGNFEEDSSIYIESISFQRDSLFLAGRYNKLSRVLPQTPWIVNGIREKETSVQELISEPLNDVICADYVKFSSSGREDVDVRCLGTGRPFVMEFINPRHVITSSLVAKDLQAEVNLSTDLVVIRDLQIISKQDLSKLKEGEEKKKKTYCALCTARNGLGTSLDVLKEAKEYTLSQPTPLRVLHRRTLAVRTKVVKILKAVAINDSFFKVYIQTDAGTYVKEFIHGDFGRTRPNLSEILNSDLDILALDVVDVKLEWPPSS